MEKLTVAQIVKKYQSFHRRLRFVTLFKRVPYLTLL
jgi:hypothetical protein